MKNKFKLASFAVVTLFVLSLSLGAIHSVRALTPVSTVYLTPNATGPLVVGTTVQVNITGDMLGTSANSGINGWDLVFDDHDSAGANLNPLSIAVSPNTGLPSGNLLTPFGSFQEPVNCVNNGVGFAPNAPGNIGCGIRDGPGIVHTAYSSLAPATPTPVSGLLGVITYSVAGPSADTISIASPCGGVGTSCDTITDGSITPVPHVTLSASVQTASPDYAVTTNNPLPFNPNGTATGAINVASLNAFAVPGLTLLSTDVYPTTGLTFSCTALAPLTVSGSSSSTCSFKSNTPGFYVITANVTDAATGPVSTFSHLGTLYVRVGDFSINEAPTTVGFPTGNTGTATVTLRSVNGFAGLVNLKSVAAPAGSSITCPTPVSVPAGGSVNSVCTLSSSTPGTYSITTTGYYNFSAPNTNLNINHGVSFGAAVWDFSVSAPTTTQTMQAGYTGTGAVILTPRFGWNRLVTLSASSSPVGVTFAATGNPCTTNQVPSNIARNCVFAAAKAGTYTVTITGTCGAAQSCPTPVVRSATFTMVVNPDFTIAALAVTPASILVGVQGTSTITITNHNFTGTISFTVNLGTPTGLNCGTTPAAVSVTVNQATAVTSLSCTSATPTTYTGVVVSSSATGTGIVAHPTAALSFKFIGFDISANPATIVNAHAGTSNSTTISLIAKNGFTGTVALTNNSTSFSPAWTVSCTLNSLLIKAVPGTNSTSCAITAPSGVSGTFHIGFTGTFGTFSNSTTVSVTVAGAVQHPTSTTISCHPKTFVVNNSTGCTVTVTDTSASPTTPSGTVTFTSSGTGTFSICNLAGTGASATCQTTYTPTVIGTGSHTVTANYPGDAQTPAHLSSSGSTAVTVTVRTTTTTLFCHPITVVVNNVTSCIATVTDGSPGTPITPGGNVGLASTGTGTFTTCTLGGVAAVATCTSTYTPTIIGAGTHSLTATFNQDATHSTSSSIGVAITVTVRSTSATILCHPTTIVVNNSTICSVTITDTSPGTFITPGGTVGLGSTGTGTFTTCTLGGAGAVATCSTTYTPTVVGIGSHTLTATFNGDTNHSNSSGNTAVTVTVRATTTTVVCSPSPVIVGSSTTCTVTIKDTSPGTLITAGGAFTLASNGAGTFTGTCTLSGTAGTATCQETYTPSGTAPRTDTITGTYSGDSTHSGSQGTFQLPVNPVAGHQTTTSISCHPVTIVVNNSTSCTVTVTDVSTGPTTPTGTVSISTSGTGIFNLACVLSGTGASATCSFTYTPTAVGTGTHMLTANYLGDAQTPAHTPSSNTTNITVTVRNTTTTITCHPTTIVVGNSTSCTITVTDTSPGTASTPTGSITLATSGTGTFSTCTFTAGSCTVTYTPTVIATGSHTLTATYSGDASHGTSQGQAAISVTHRSTTTSVVCSPSPVTIGSPAICTAAVRDMSPGTAITPGGTIAFSTNATAGSFTIVGSPCTLGGSGATATCQVTYTPTGAAPRHDQITGTYSGDTNHPTNQGTFLLAVTAQAAHATTTTISCHPTTIAVSNSTSCTITVTDTSPGTAITPSGNVGLASTGTGTFTTCTLGGTGATATCSTTYTPTAIGTGSHSLTATFNGDTNHSGSSGNTAISVTLRTTTTTVVCSPFSVTINTASTCTATVTEASTAGTPITPGGTVAFASTGGPGLFSSTTCTLVGGKCSVAFTPSTTTVSNISATYGGDATHSGSSTATAATVTGSPPSQKDFTLSVSFASVTLVEDSIGRAFVTLHSNGFNGSVDLSVKISPAGQGLTAHLVRIHVRLGPTSTQRILLIVSGDEARAGDYTVTVTGMSGSLSHSASLKVTLTHPGDDEGRSLQQFLTWFLSQVATSRWD